jgi:uncharacterized protein YjbI with pentapeptide repeats
MLTYISQIRSLFSTNSSEIYNIQLRTRTIYELRYNAISSNAKFKGVADFYGADFQADADISNSNFYGKTYFSEQFNGKTNFNYVLFEGKDKVIFDIKNLLMFLS